MGHYYAEMACDRCGQLRCICPPQEDTRPYRWINDDDAEFTPITIFDFDKKYATLQTTYGPIPGMPVMLRMKKLEFKNKEEAEEHSTVLQRRRLADLEQRLAETKEKIKDAKARLKKRK